MRKFIYILSAVILSILLLGCFSKENMSTQSIVSNNNRNRITSEDEKNIYFTNAFSVKKISKENNEVESIFQLGDFSDQIVEIECFSDKLYLLTFSNQLIVMSTDGTDAAEIELSGFTSPSFYTFDSELYLVENTTGDVSKVNTVNLVLEEADSAIINQYIATDGTTFVKKLENDLGKVYVLVDGKETLFSGENESVILNRMNFTDSYVFYYAFDMEGVEDLSSLHSFSLYRVDLNGENKKLIREVELYENSGNIRYDNEFIYVSINAEEYLKIHKETFEETNIIDKINEFGVSYEISNERFFDFASTSFWDSATGEMIEF